MPDFEDDIPDPVNPADRAWNDELRLYAHQISTNSPSVLQRQLDTINLHGLAKYVVTMYPSTTDSDTMVVIYRMPRRVAASHRLA